MRRRHDPVPIEQRLAGEQAATESPPDLGSRRAGVQPLSREQRALVILDGLVIAKRSAGVIAGRDRVAQHLGVGPTAELAEVKGEFSGALGPFTGERGDRLGSLAMPQAALGRRERSDDSRAHDVVGEGQPAIGIFDQKLARQQRLCCFKPRRAGELLDQVERDRAADHGELLQQGARRSGHAFQTREHEITNLGCASQVGQREAGIEAGHQLGQRAGAVGLQERLDGDVEEQRVAAAGRCQPLRQRGQPIRRRTRQASQQLGNLSGIEATEHHWAQQQLAAERAQQRMQRRVVGQFLGAIGQHHQHGAARRVPGHPPQRRQGGLIGPLGIVAHDDQRRSVGQRQGQVHQPIEHTIAPFGRRNVGQSGKVGAAIAQHRQQVGHLRQGRRGQPAQHGIWGGAQQRA